MFVTTRFFLLFTLLTVIPFENSSAGAPELDSTLTQYLNSISRYKNIEYSAKYLSEGSSNKAKAKQGVNGLVVIKEFEAKVDFGLSHFYLKETRYPSDLDGTVHAVTSWHDGVLRHYVDDNSPGLRSGVVAADGVIRKRELETGDLPEGPRTALGFGITELVGKSLNLPDLILHLPAERISSNRYLIKNFFDWSTSFGSAYDLEFTLDPTHDFLPTTFIIWDRTLGEKPSKEKIAECTVKQFVKSQDMWCPCEIAFASFTQSKYIGGYVIVVDKPSVRLNFPASKDDYVLEFPPEKTYIDIAKKVQYRPNKPPRNIAGSFAEASAVIQGKPITQAQTIQGALFVYPILGLAVAVFLMVSLKLRSWQKRPF